MQIGNLLFLSFELSESNKSLSGWPMFIYVNGIHVDIITEKETKENKSSC